MTKKISDLNKKMNNKKAEIAKKEFVLEAFKAEPSKIEKRLESLNPKKI